MVLKNNSLMYATRAILLQAIIGLLLSLISSLYCCAADSSRRLQIQTDSPNVSISKEWVAGSGVRKLYDTPAGAVYEFQSSMFEPDCWFHEGQHANCKACTKREETKGKFYALQIGLFKDQSEALKKSRRFIVIDFMERKFPAIQKQILSQGFAVVNSRHLAMRDGANVDMIIDCGQFDANQNGAQSGSLTCSRNDSRRRTQAVPVELFFNNLTGPGWMPQIYDLIPWRIIIDTRQHGTISLNINGCKWIQRSYEIFSTPAPVQSIGIFIPRGNAKRIIELSSPTVTLVENEEKLAKLPPLSPLEYPYRSYPADLTKINKSGNPDALYSYAMRLINGEEASVDFIQGTELLKKAAADRHVLAMYQLGVCYYRGLGVEQNDDIAITWLSKAQDEYCQDAIALKYLIMAKNGTFPKDRKKQNDAFKKLSEISCLGNNAIMFGDIINTASLMPLIDFSNDPHLLFFNGRYYFPEKPLICSQSCNHSNENNGSFNFFNRSYLRGQCNISANNGSRFAAEWIDQAIAMDFSPAMLFKGRILSDPQKYHDKWQVSDGRQAALALFEHGAELGNTDCVVDALLIKAQLGLLNTANLDAAQIILRENHVYYVLCYCLANKTLPGCAEFLSGNYASAIQIWKKNSDAWSAFLLGAYSYDEYQRQMFLAPGTRPDQGKELYQSAIAYWKQAANAGIVPAQYLLGKIYLSGNKVIGDHTEGRKLLQQAAGKGHIGALLELAEDSWNTYKNKKQALEYLSKPCDANIPEAWVLLSRILEKSYSTSEQAKLLNAYQHAVELGNPEACNKLGIAYYKGSIGLKKDSTMAAEYWSKCYKLDTAWRNQQIDNFYWGKIKCPKMIYGNNGLPAVWNCWPLGLSDATVKKYYDTY